MSMESNMSLKSIIVSTLLLVSTGSAVGKTKELITITRTDNNEKIQIALRSRCIWFMHPTGLFYHPYCTSGQFPFCT